MNVFTGLRSVQSFSLSLTVPWRYELRAPFSTASLASADSCLSNSSVKATWQDPPAEKMSAGWTQSCAVTWWRLSPMVRSKVSASRRGDELRRNLDERINK